MFSKYLFFLFFGLILCTSCDKEDLGSELIGTWTFVHVDEEERDSINDQVLSSTSVISKYQDNQLRFSADGKVEFTESYIMYKGDWELTSKAETVERLNEDGECEKVTVYKDCIRQNIWDAAKHYRLVEWIFRIEDNSLFLEEDLGNSRFRVYELKRVRGER